MHSQFLPNRGRNCSKNRALIYLRIQVRQSRKPLVLEQESNEWKMGKILQFTRLRFNEPLVAENGNKKLFSLRQNREIMKIKNQSETKRK